MPEKVLVDDRFWSHVLRVFDVKSCWLWDGSRTEKGYGRFQVGGRVERAHRFAYELASGPIPEGMLVLHKCDNPPCVRPSHLFVGTPSDNTNDMLLRKGRWRRPRTLAGVRNHSARLNDDAVRDARARYADGEAMATLASEHGVSISAMRRAVSGATWSHVI